MQITVQMTFNRSGELFGNPRVTFETAGASDDERLAYRIAGADALKRCAPLPFTQALGNAVAGVLPPCDSSTTENSSRESDMTDAANTMTLETTKGKVVIAMRPDLAPGHIARIKELVNEGFYD